MLVTECTRVKPVGWALTITRLVESPAMEAANECLRSTVERTTSSSPIVRTRRSAKLYQDMGSRLGRPCGLRASPPTPIRERTWSAHQRPSNLVAPILTQPVFVTASREF